MVPKEGLEPSWYRYRQILSLVRLPFRHFGLPPYYTSLNIKIKAKTEKTLFLRAFFE